MLTTGLGILDKAITKHGLVNANTMTKIQRSLFIPAKMNSQEVAKGLRKLELFRVPYCIQMSLAADELDDDRILHFLTMPDGKPLLWLLMTDSGQLLSQAFCQTNRNYPTVCKLVVRHLLHEAKSQNQEAA
jgi:hypothetical protein